MIRRTSNDAEPPAGTVVRDCYGRLWRRVGDGRAWIPLEDDLSRRNDDPETWVRVAGNFGPVEVVALKGRS